MGNFCIELKRVLLATGQLLLVIAAALALGACGRGAAETTIIPATASAVPPTTAATARPSTPASTPIGTKITPTKPATTVAPPPASTQLPLQSVTIEPVTIEPAFGGATFDRPTNLVQPDDGTGRHFLTEQAGRILALSGGPDGSEEQVFLDIRDRVNDSGNEEGLLGLAFAPDYAESGRFFVYYSASGPRRSVVSRFTASPGDPATADPASESVVMEIPQPFRNHNGGQLAFGPDGFLYIGLGDGGSGGDPQGNGQNLMTMLGSILRIDVSASSAGNPYSVPADNPFLGVASARPEVWAYGFRNPWRFSFDRDTGQLWVGDVGQNSFEEVDLAVKGGNYGWNTLEGSHCFRPSSSCDPKGTILPVVEYGASQGCSVIGGYVYRGGDGPLLRGVYLYSDYCSGQIWGVRRDGQEIMAHQKLADTGFQITSFGQDLEGNLYILTEDSGVYRIVP